VAEIATHERHDKFVGCNCFCCYSECRGLDERVGFVFVLQQRFDFFSQLGIVATRLIQKSEALLHFKLERR